MANPKALVVSGDGINCEQETDYALRLAGFDSAIIHISDLLAAPETMLQYKMLALPGGFSFGDEIASGKVLALKMQQYMSDALCKYIERGSLLIGICNGFQVLVQLGVLPNSQPPFKRIVGLDHNQNGKFLNKWVELQVDQSINCPFFKGLSTIELPIRHGEGRLTLETGGAIGDAVQALVRKQSPLKYSENVNGSFENIAALCNDKGNVLGLMPHPEAYVRFTQHPNWCGRAIAQEASMQSKKPDGLMIMTNAFAALN